MKLLFLMHYLNIEQLVSYFKKCKTIFQNDIFYPKNILLRIKKINGDYVLKSAKNILSSVENCDNGLNGLGKLTSKTA